MSTYWSLIHMSAPQSVRRPRRPAAIRTSLKLLVIYGLEISYEIGGGLDAGKVGRGRAVDEAQGQ